MKGIQKWLISLGTMLFFVFQLPMLAWAANNTNGSEENPFTNMKEKMKFNWRIMEGADWVFYIIMLLLSGLMIYLLIATVGGVITHLVKIKHGKASLKDRNFWLETGFIIFFIVLLFSGGFFKILESIYSWTNKQDIGGDGKATSYVVQMHDRA
ncbi:MULTISPECIES: hypothetical protein [Paenibacillus]|uniref:hypothetical protein n=1 Tax=Paenibacillus TaxID=44249 RepID=UPI000B59457D|nr:MULTISPECIES: hypothetical protein [Paenibacillus]